MLVFWFGLGGLGVSVLGLALLEARPLFSGWAGLCWLLASAQAVIGLGGVYFLYRAIALASPTRVMVIRSFEIVFSYILQVINKLRASKINNGSLAGDRIWDGGAFPGLPGRLYDRGRCFLYGV